MDPIITVVVALVAAICGVLVGAIVINRRNEQAGKSTRDIVKAAQTEAESIKSKALLDAQKQAMDLRAEAQAESAERFKELRNAENRVMQIEAKLDRRGESLDEREGKLAAYENKLESFEGELDARSHELDVAFEDVSLKLQAIAGMTPDQAKQELLDGLREELTHESARIIRDSEARTRAESDRRAREILSVAIQRMAAEHTTETTVSTIALPSDDLKGRIIGREGRNIRSFEQLTGCNLIIDDTPECVTITCFDPVRREIGRITMENLIADGRIHPARIEELHAKARKLVERKVQEAGEQATFEMGIHDLHPELERVLGRLRYRTSYGQNVLNHSLEVAFLCALMAEELGLDPVPFKRAGLLHDLGKAVDHEVEGPHAVIGADLARRFGEKPEIVHAIEAHHYDVEPNSVLDVLVMAADAISAARPGARRETYEAYIKRLEQLEEIANSYQGVERTYAIQAGREVRVMVEPSVVDEDAATVMAHEIAKRIENEMQYPGQVKVVVIRESRAVGLAK